MGVVAVGDGTTPAVAGIETFRATTRAAWTTLVVAHAARV